MEAAGSFETLAYLCETKRHHIQEERVQHSYCYTETRYNKIFTFVER